MTDTTCVCCGRPMPDTAYACTSCTGKAAGQLDTLVDMTPAARDVAHGQARHGSTGGGSDEGRLPLNLAATQRLDEVQNTLSTWVRHITAERGGQPRTVGSDPIVHSAWYLQSSLEWLRHRPEVDEVLADIAACARIVAGIARGPAAQKYLGPCGARSDECYHGPDCFGSGPECDRANPEPCDGDVYAREGASTGRCRTCGAEVSTDERRAWLDGEVRAHAFRAAHLAEAYGLNVNTIRSWAARGHLRSYWRTEAGLTIEWVDPVLDERLVGEAARERLGEISDEIQARGGRLHYVGDVLDLAAADAARRGTQQAKRARREAAREAAEMGA